MICVMEKREGKDRFFRWELLPGIIALAWPTMLEQLLHTAVQYIDTAMVGSLGMEATAAVGSTVTVNWMVGSTVSAFGVGFLAIISQALGSGDIEKAKRACAQSVTTVLAVGALFTIICLGISGYVPVWMHVEESLRRSASVYFFILYLPMLPRTASMIFGTVLRAAGDTRTPMRIGLGVNVLNIIMNFLFIYPSRTLTILGTSVPVWGAGWGVAGAAAASALSMTAGGLAVTAALLRHPQISPRGIGLAPDREILIPSMRIAFPNMLQRFGTSLGYVVFASMINALGGVATAAHTVANTVESAFYVPGYGMQTAAATLTGNAVGAGDEKRRRDTSRLIFLGEAIMMIVSGAALFFFAPRMVRIFIRDEAVIELGSKVLRMVALSEPFYGIAIVTEGMLQGAGKTSVPFVLNIAGMWGIRILGTFICTRFLSGGLVSAWGCMITHNVLLFAAFFVYYLRCDWHSERTV